MKKLICAKDVEDLIKKGEKTLRIDSNTIITPSAKDAASANGIEIVCGGCEAASAPSAAKMQDGGIDSETIYLALKAMIEKGMLTGVFDTGSAASLPPYRAERDPSGFKLVRGGSARLEPLETGNPQDKVFYQELIGSEDRSSMNAGFMTIEKSRFDWDVACEEIYYIIEGVLTISINGQVYTAHQGDSLYCPKGAQVAWGAPDKVKVFYATY